MWFETLTGAAEGRPDEVRALFDIDGAALVSRANGRRIHAGRLDTPSLAELRRQPVPRGGRLRLREVVANAGALHRDPANAGALFQVASQFNLLEMISPSVTPAQGISGYQHDPTQGPACAIACGGGTIWRNYFVEIDGQLGQTEGVQLDMLADLGAALGNGAGRLWVMRNGYALPRPGGLTEVARHLSQAGEAERDQLRGLLRIGLQHDTEVTTAPGGHRVSQAYCSALPVSYGEGDAAAWEPFARLVLEAAYEATLRAALASRAPLFLTRIGGGAFGNRPGWIDDALNRALALFADCDLDVAMVSYGQPDRSLAPLLARFGRG